MQSSQRCLAIQRFISSEVNELILLIRMYTGCPLSLWETAARKGVFPAAPRPRFPLFFYRQSRHHQVRRDSPAEVYRRHVS